MSRPVINPGKVDWSGENPGMYLKEKVDGPFAIHILTKHHWRLFLITEILLDFSPTIW